MPRLFAALFLLAAVAGCDSYGLADVDVDALVLTATDDGFLIETEVDLECLNYPLLVDTDASATRVAVEVEGVGEIGVCQQALGPARAVVPFPDDFDGLKVEVEIELDGETDRFDYSCDEGTCRLGPIGRPTFTRVGPRQPVN